MTFLPPSRPPHTSPPDQRSDALDLRLTCALEQPPAIHIPANFAARVAAKAPARPGLNLTPPHFGRRASLTAIAALIVCMVAFAPTAFRTATFPLALELSFVAEFVGLIILISLRPSLLR